jgi:vacuolar-type H+-ATPase subunit H
MAEERSLLQKIREKELELSVLIDAARREAEEKIRAGHAEADAIVQAAEREGAEEAKAVYAAEMERTGKEVSALREQAGAERDRVRKQGEEHLGKAVERILHHVIAE